MNKKFTLLFLVIFLCSVTEAYTQSCTYTHRKRISIDPAKVSGPIDLTNFPLLINITSDVNLRTLANGGRVQNANGWDIIFTLMDGVTIIDHQLEKYSATTGEYVAHVKVPVVSTTYNTHIYMYYGKAGVGADPSVSSVWDANYKGVYHFHNDFNDKTSTGNNGTNFGTVNPSCVLANGISYDNTVTRRVQIGTSGWNSNTGTIELWGKPNSFLASETYFFGHTTLPAYTNRLQIYCINGFLRLGLGASHSVGGDIASLTAGTWYHIVLAWSGAAGTGTYTVYVNGVSASTGAYAAFSGIETYSDIGNDGNSATRNEALRGAIDEFRISNIRRTADWELTCYNNQNSASTFYSITPEPDRWIGGTSTNWGTASNWFSNAVPANGADIIITNGINEPTLDASRQIAGMWIQTGAILSLGTNNLSYRYDITNCGTIAGGTGTITANSTTQCIEQYLSGSGTYNLYNLTVNNTFVVTPSLRLLKDVNVNGLLSLTSGIIYTTTTNILALSNTATSQSGFAQSFVSGPMSKNGSANFVFPVGKGNKWRRLSVTGLSASSTFRAEYFNTPYSSIVPVSAPLTNVSTVEYWQLDRIAGGNATVTLYWEDATASGINNCPDLTIARWNGAGWDERAGTISGPSVCTGAGAGTVVSNALITAFSPFTFGSKNNAINQLPISLLNFDAMPCDDYVCLEWSTATEINNDFFTIQRTKNGSDFEFVATIDGAGNSSSVLNYSSVDNMNYDGVSYYRLKQTDFNGDCSFSDLKKVNFETNNEFTFDLYQNPIDGSAITVLLNAGTGEEIKIVIYDILGKESYSEKIIGDGKGENIYSLDLSDKLSVGMYFITAASQKTIYSKKLIVK